MKEADKSMWFLKYCIIVASLLTGSMAQAQQPRDARAVVDGFHGTLLAAMKDGRKLGFAGRQRLIDPVVRQHFDLPLMSRVVVGPVWPTLSTAEQTAVTDAFSRWAVASYAGRFNAFDGEQFITGDVGDGGRGTVQVRSQIRPKGEAPTVLTYRMKSDGKAWKIVDVYLDGTVSQLANWRSEYAAVLRRQGVSGLVSRLNQMTVDFAKKN